MGPTFVKCFLFLLTYLNVQQNIENFDITYLNGAPIKNSPLEKNSVFQPWEYCRFEPNFQSLYKATSYPANFIEITYKLMVQQIQQFKLLSPLFQVNIQLHIEYSRIMNQILQSFL